MRIDFSRFEFLSFDCYGTLINWEQGILSVLQPILRSHGVAMQDNAVLTSYGEIEPKLQTPYRRYWDVLRGVVQEFGNQARFDVTDEEMDSLPESLKAWSPYPDTVAALKRLQRRFKLVILSNIDDDLFAHSAKLLEVRFDEVITAEQVKSYKPDPAHWRELLQRCETAPDRVLHVGQSLYHDVEPAKRLGFTTAWVHRQPGYGATMAAKETPHLEVSNLMALADLALAG